MLVIIFKIIKVVSMCITFYAISMMLFLYLNHKYETRKRK